MSQPSPLSFRSAPSLSPPPFRTDAFAVLTYVSLALLSPHDPTPFLAQAATLVSAVHATLGAPRGDEPPSSRPPASTFPAGGLRIGKLAPPGTPDGDGQYLHYTLKWVHALCGLARATGVKGWADDAVALVRATHPRFTLTTPTGRRRFYWKALPDLSGPAPGGGGEGGLDAFGAVVAYAWAASTAVALGGAGGSGGGEAAGRGPSSPPPLAAEVEEAASIAARVAAGRANRPLVALDPLDAGEALWTAAWAADPSVFGPFASAAAAAGAAAGAAAAPPPWASRLEVDAVASLANQTAAGLFNPHVTAARHRLAFREFGALLGAAVSPHPAAAAWARSVGPAIEDLWAGPAGTGDRLLWARDGDITPVMAAAAGVAPWGGAWAPPGRAAAKAAGGGEEEGGEGGVEP